MYTHEYYKLFAYSYENAITSPGPVRVCGQTGNRHMYIYIWQFLVCFVPKWQVTNPSVSMFS